MMNWEVPKIIIISTSDLLFVSQLFAFDTKPAAALPAAGGCHRPTIWCFVLMTSRQLEPSTPVGSFCHLGLMMHGNVVLKRLKLFDVFNPSLSNFQSHCD